MTEDDARRQPPEEPTPPPATGQPAAGATPPPPPPPGGYAPPAQGGGFATRYGLMRPTHGRYIAGVCAAIGRATNTDPVLWRVLFAVLGLFGGVGILAYLVCWVAIPADTDTTSPIESLFGRGRSNTSPALVIVLAVAIAVMFGFIVTDGFRAALLGATALIVGAVVLSRTSGRGTGAPGGYGAPGYVGTGVAGAGYGGSSMADAGYGASGATGHGGPGATGYGGPGGAGYGDPVGAGYGGAGGVGPGGSGAAAGPGPGYPPAPPAGPGPYPGAGAGAVAPMASGGAGPADTPPLGYRPPAPAGATAAYGSPYQPPSGAAVTAPLPPMPPGPGMPGGPGYRPPFAPHGPYASRGYPPVQAPPPPKPPKPPRERSALGAATFSLIFMALGVVAVLDLTDTISAHPSTYFAAALGTVALGLLIGTWLGRARWLIALGLPLALALGVSSVVEHYDENVQTNGGSVLWQPASFDDLGDRYEQRVGDARLDLSQLDFTNRRQQVSVEMSAGRLEVIVPPTVDTRVDLEVNVGDALIFGRRYDGLGNTSQIVDNGADGPGGGNLTLVLHVNLGSLEVHR